MSFISMQWKWFSSDLERNVFRYSFSSTVLAVIFSMNVNIFFRVGVSVFSCKFHWHFISPHSLRSSIRLFTRGQPKSCWGQSDFYQQVAWWATWIFRELLRPGPHEYNLDISVSIPHILSNQVQFLICDSHYSWCCINHVMQFPLWQQGS